MNRPVAVSILAVLVLISAIYNVIIGVLLMLSPLGTNPTFTDLAGNAHEVSGFYLFFTGTIDLIFGLLMFWLARITMAGSTQAYMLINVLAILNILFGMLSLPYGWGIVAISIVALILVNLPGSRSFLSRTLAPGDL
jgi:hypothetical protein